MKKTAISVLASICIFANNVEASGIPVIDVASIAQAVMRYSQTLKDYANQIQQYQQMVEDTTNFKKQMDDMGVGMKNMNQILGLSANMINQMEETYENINHIPQNMYGDIAKIQSACSFLEQKSQFFGMEIKTTDNSLSNKINRCTYALRNGTTLNKTMQEIQEKRLKSTDPIERANYEAQIKNIENARRFLQERDNFEKTNNLLTFQDVYYSNDETKLYSKVKMNKDIKILSQQLKKVENQKQAQALTNTLLLKILEILQQQYELNVNYTSAAISNKQFQQNHCNNLTQESYNHSIKEYKRNDQIFKPEIKKLPKDELGLPKFIFTQRN